MTTAGAKQKGRRLVQRVRAMLLMAAPVLLPDDVVIPATSQPGADLCLSPAAQAVFPFSIEAKNQEQIRIWAALEQCRANTPPGRIPLLVFSRNRAPEPVACLPLSDLLTLVRGRG